MVGLQKQRQRNNMTIRQRKEVLEKLHDHFVEYNLPKEISMDGYMTIVAQPVLRRAIKKNFNNWPRTIRALEIAYPKLFTKTVEVKVEEPEVKLNPLKALSKAKAVKTVSDKANEEG